jgi:hypothetical protein
VTLREDPLDRITHIIEPIDVGQGGPFDVVNVLPGPPPVDQLGLVEPVEALG